MKRKERRRKGEEKGVQEDWKIKKSQEKKEKNNERMVKENVWDSARLKKRKS